MLSVNETTCWLLEIRFVMAFLLAADKVLQRYARNLRAPVLNCAQDDKCIFEITSSKLLRFTLKSAGFPRERMGWEHTGFQDFYFPVLARPGGKR